MGSLFCPEPSFPPSGQDKLDPRKGCPQPQKRGGVLPGLCRPLAVTGAYDTRRWLSLSRCDGGWQVGRTRGQSRGLRGRVQGKGGGLCESYPLPLESYVKAVLVLFPVAVLRSAVAFVRRTI